MHIEVQPGDTTAELRKILLAETGLSMHDQRILFLGFELESSRTLGAYNIHGDCELFCFPQRRPSEDLAASLAFKRPARSQQLKKASTAPPGTMETASKLEGQTASPDTGSVRDKGGILPKALTPSSVTSSSVSREGIACTGSMRARAELPAPGSFKRATLAASASFRSLRIAATSSSMIVPPGRHSPGPASPSRASPTKARESPIPSLRRG